jgi:hypothetical protein
MNRKGRPVTINQTADDHGPAAAALPQPSGVAAEQETLRRPRALRIGDRVRSLVDDVCVSVGLEGLVVNVAPPRYGAPARARILWDNETVSMADGTTFEQLGGRETTATDDESRVA